MSQNPENLSRRLEIYPTTSHSSLSGNSSIRTFHRPQPARLSCVAKIQAAAGQGRAPSSAPMPSPTPSDPTAPGSPLLWPPQAMGWEGGARTGLPRAYRGARACSESPLAGFAQLPEMGQSGQAGFSRSLLPASRNLSCLPKPSSSQRYLSVSTGPGYSSGHLTARPQTFFPRSLHRQVRANTTQTK